LNLRLLNKITLIRGCERCEHVTTLSNMWQTCQSSWQQCNVSTFVLVLGCVTVIEFIHILNQKITLEKNNAIFWWSFFLNNSMVLLMSNLCILWEFRLFSKACIFYDDTGKAEKEQTYCQGYLYIHYANS